MDGRTMGCLLEDWTLTKIDWSCCRCLHPRFVQSCLKISSLVLQLCHPTSIADSIDAVVGGNDIGLHQHDEPRLGYCLCSSCFGIAAAKATMNSSTTFAGAMRCFYSLLFGRNCSAPRFEACWMFYACGW